MKPLRHKLAVSVRLRWVLKKLLRQWGFKNVWLETVWLPRSRRMAPALAKPPRPEPMRTPLLLFEEGTMAGLTKKTLSALEAAKKDERAILTYDRDRCKREAEHYLKFLAVQKENEQTLGELRDVLLAEIEPWHIDVCRAGGVYQPTVHVPTASGTLQIQFQNRWGKISTKLEPDLRAVLRDRYDRFFELRFGLKLKRDVAEDKGQLDQLVRDLVKALGQERFAACFEVDLSLAPTKAFTEERPLSPAKLAELELQQVIPFSVAKAA